MSPFLPTSYPETAHVDTLYQFIANGSSSVWFNNLLQATPECVLSKSGELKGYAYPPYPAYPPSDRNDSTYKTNYAANINFNLSQIQEEQSDLQFRCSRSSISFTHELVREQDHQQAGLNRTPSLQRAKRKKHRPKVVIEGKPKKAPRMNAGDTDKRHYSNQANLSTPTIPVVPSVKTDERKGIGPSCKRSLNFQEENTNESTGSGSGKIQQQQAIQFTEIHRSPIDSNESTGQINQPKVLETLPENCRGGTGLDLNVQLKTSDDSLQQEDSSSSTPVVARQPFRENMKTLARKKYQKYRLQNSQKINYPTIPAALDNEESIFMTRFSPEAPKSRLNSMEDITRLTFDMNLRRNGASAENADTPYAINTELINLYGRGPSPSNSASKSDRLCVLDTHQHTANCSQNELELDLSCSSIFEDVRDLESSCHKDKSEKNRYVASIQLSTITSMHSPSYQSHSSSVDQGKCANTNGSSDDTVDSTCSHASPQACEEQYVDPSIRLSMQIQNATEAAIPTEMCNNNLVPAHLNSGMQVRATLQNHTSEHCSPVHRTNQKTKPLSLILMPEERERILSFNEEKNTPEMNNILVPYTRQMQVIPYFNRFTKRHAARPKVDLDEETNKMWKMLMWNDESRGTDDTDQEKEKKWNEERQIFCSRVNSFIARMHNVQGNRRFSRWKGSVVDSVIGVFLTQNVSDHLSSSAYMALAAKFPCKNGNTFVEGDEVGMNHSEAVNENAFWYETKITHQNIGPTTTSSSGDNTFPEGTNISCTEEMTYSPKDKNTSHQRANTFKVEKMASSQKSDIINKSGEESTPIQDTASAQFWPVSAQNFNTIEFMKDTDEASNGDIFRYHTKGKTEKSGTKISSEDNTSPIKNKFSCNEEIRFFHQDTNAFTRTGISKVEETAFSQNNENIYWTRGKDELNTISTQSWKTFSQNMLGMEETDETKSFSDSNFNLDYRVPAFMFDELDGSNTLSFTELLQMQIPGTFEGGLNRDSNLEAPTTVQDVTNFRYHTVQREPNPSISPPPSHQAHRRDLLFNPVGSSAHSFTELLQMQVPNTFLEEQPNWSNDLVADMTFQGVGLNYHTIQRGANPSIRSLPSCQTHRRDHLFNKHVPLPQFEFEYPGYLEDEISGSPLSQYNFMDKKSKSSTEKADIEKENDTNSSVLLPLWKDLTNGSWAIPCRQAFCGSDKTQPVLSRTIDQSQVSKTSESETAFAGYKNIQEKLQSLEKATESKLMQLRPDHKNTGIWSADKTAELNLPQSGFEKKTSANSWLHEAASGREKDRKPKKQGKQKSQDWDNLRRQTCQVYTKERSPDTMDSINYEALRCADVTEISDVIKERGMNNMLAQRIKDFLDRLINDHGGINLEWLRDVPPDKAKEYLLSIRGLGLKSVECVRLLTLHHLAFPVDTNVGRICVRLGWVPLRPLPESLQLHLLELYPVLESIQKYLWPRLCKLDQRTLYELHYQMITFGKVFCTKSRPNCNACPMRAECRHFASAFASARLALTGPAERSLISSFTPLATLKMNQYEQTSMHISLPIAPNTQADSEKRKCEPIIEEPLSPEPEPVHNLSDIEDAFWMDTDEIPMIKLNLEEFSKNVLNYVQANNAENQGWDMSKALVALTPEVASIPVPKLKNVSRLRTEHQVYELPDNHSLLKQLASREPDDPCPYLLAIWAPGETDELVQPHEESCSSCESGNVYVNSFCACTWSRNPSTQTIKGTLLIPCRTAMQGNFPLNGTYFQVNEVFADHDSSHRPIDVPRSLIWNLPRRTVYFGTSVPSIFRGLTTEAIQQCFWKGFVCVRGFDRRTRAPRPLASRLHFPASKLVAAKRAQKKTSTQGNFPPSILRPGVASAVHGLYLDLGKSREKKMKRKICGGKLSLLWLRKGTRKK